MVAGLGVASLATFWYLRSEIPQSISFPLPIIIGFPAIFIVMFHVAKHLLRDTGKVAISIGPEGVKFDRYKLIKWSDIKEVYVVDDSDSPRCLWLDVKEGVAFLPNEPRPLIWLAEKTGLHQSIDITGYGSFSMSDSEIRKLLKKGIQDFGSQ